ncbi:hypothetical protein PR048_000631 [Dryococelus australis]|uniref:Uncharacterized protein n=1 Tax=Dryococelus australis TaxID=614101 RepID=A0ABQ9IFB2_9NEOP|nr:hypothetical protein PR048_000631 [Dryococelus australis]
MDNTYELHVFRDSSEVACIAVVYLHAMQVDGRATISLVFLSVKWPPYKFLIPHFEQCAAAAISKALKYAKTILKQVLMISGMWTWSDPNVALI